MMINTPPRAICYANFLASHITNYTLQYVQCALIRNHVSKRTWSSTAHSSGMQLGSLSVHSMSAYSQSGPSQIHKGVMKGCWCRNRFLLPDTPLQELTHHSVSEMGIHWRGGSRIKIGSPPRSLTTTPGRFSTQLLKRHLEIDRYQCKKMYNFQRQHSTWSVVDSWQAWLTQQWGNH